jgi:hypothetical protein
MCFDLVYSCRSKRHQGISRLWPDCGFDIVSHQQHRENYDWFPVIDIRETKFQANPFRPSPNTEQADLLLFAHGSKNRADDSNELKKCGRQDFSEQVVNRPIINAGGVLGKPSAFIAIHDLMLDEKFNGCNNQVVLNVVV